MSKVSLQNVQDIYSNKAVNYFNVTISQCIITCNQYLSVVIGLGCDQQNTHINSLIEVNVPGHDPQTF